MKETEFNGVFTDDDDTGLYMPDDDADIYNRYCELVDEGMTDREARFQLEEEFGPSPDNYASLIDTVEDSTGNYTVGDDGMSEEEVQSWDDDQVDYDDEGWEKHNAEIANEIDPHSMDIPGFDGFHDDYASNEDEAIDDWLNESTKMNKNQLFENVLNEVSDFAYDEPKSFEDRLEPAMHTKATTQGIGYKGPTGKILEVIKNVVGATNQAVNKAYRSNEFKSLASEQKLHQMMKDIKADRATPKDCAEALFKNLKQGWEIKKVVTDNLAASDEMEYGWTSAVADVSAGYSNVRDQRFWGGLFNIFKNLFKFVYNSILKLTTIVTLPRDLIVSVKAGMDGAHIVKGDDTIQYIQKCEKIVEQLWEAAQKVQAGQDPLAESYKAYCEQLSKSKLREAHIRKFNETYRT